MAKRQKKSANSKKAGFTDEGKLDNPFAAAFGKLAAKKDLPEGPKTEPQEEISESPADSMPERVILRLERKGRGGKTVTVAEVRGGNKVLEQWAKSLKKKLGVGASVEDGTMVFQGDVRDRLKPLLEAEGVRRVG